WPRAAGADLSSHVPHDRSKLADVSVGIAVRPGIRHGDRDRRARDRGGGSVERTSDGGDPRVPNAVCRGDVAGGYDRQRVDGGRIWMGERPADAEALLQPGGDGDVRGGGAGGGRSGSAGPG